MSSSVSSVLPFRGDQAAYESDPSVRAAIVPLLRTAQRELDVMDDPREVQRLVVRRALSSGFGITATDRAVLKAMWQYRTMQRLYKREEKTDFGRNSRAFSGTVTRDLSQGRMTRTDFTANMDMRAASIAQSEQAAAAAKERKSIVIILWKRP